jgi:hypothetical protein
MRIVVFGATGSTGRHVVDQSLFAGHDVTAVVRRPDQVAPRPRLVARAGDVLDAAGLHESCSGADAVVSCVGPRSNVRPGTVMSAGERPFGSNGCNNARIEHPRTLARREALRDDEADGRMMSKMCIPRTLDVG